MIAGIQRVHRFLNNHPLGRRASLQSWKRFVSWQIGSRLLPYPVELPWIGESCLVVERGMTGATGNWYCGLHEFSDMALLLHYFGAEASEGGFLDVGANIGSYTVLASAVCDQRTLALEPIDETHRRLQRNLRANEVEELVCAPLGAAGRAEGKLRFSCDQDTTNQVVGKDYEGSVVEVTVRSLDDWLIDYGEIPAFWKIDVEGFEEEVLCGAKNTLSDPGVEVVLLEADEDRIASIMAEHGFKRAFYDAFERRLSIGKFSGVPNNHLWVRNAERVETRCHMSRVYNVLGVEF